MTEQYAASASKFSCASSAYVGLRIRMLSVLLSILIIRLHVLPRVGCFSPERS